MKEVLILGCIAFIATACSRPKNESGGEGTQAKELPTLLLTKMNGDSLQTRSLEGLVILVFFSPDCDHCQREAEDIRRHIDAFKDYSLYFISPSPAEEIKTFAITYGLSGYPNVVFARADVAAVVNEMGKVSTPTLCIYSKEKQLVKRFDGETDMDEIVKFL